MMTPEELSESAQMLMQLDFHDADGKPRPMVFRNPVKILVANQVDEVKPLLKELQQGVEAGLYAAGYLSYEAAPAFDPAFRVHCDYAMPLAWFGLFDKPEEPAAADAEQQGSYQMSDWQPTVDRERYKACITAIREAIARGETYQTNYTIRLRGSFSGDAQSFYHDLRKRQHGHYSAYLQVGRYRILSASPELFFRWKGNTLTTKPMKGTVKRGRFVAEDRANAEWLAQSEKNKAENVMIVDLLRNDLGTIAEIGSVHVPRLFEIERYRTVYQMTSTVEATTRDETTIEEVFTALFPCGSITGAPKVSTMKLIEQLEDSPREVYCGTIGYITPQKEAVFNVAIRTVLIDAKTGAAEYGVGGGITWDSQAEDEYDEVVAKSAILTTDMPAFSLLETMKLVGGEYDLLDWHLERLQESAAYFGIPLDRVQLDAELQAYARKTNENMRVRLLVSQQGTIALEGVPLAEQPIVPQPFAVASRPIASANPFFYHKTTERSIYQVHKNEYPDAFDVLLWNERGELTEFTIGNFVVEIDGEKLTPPITSGLLAGTLRAELLAQGAIAERVLTMDDLTRATQVWLINSVRGWVPVYRMDDLPSHSA
ncbi:UNVERIFIED_CONTAM: para-aminobenzoate synthetase/4-amino-4-deoxychorismate lyase [Brevibacillus sp. OAP136]